jgi:hypothetical protein
MSARRLGRELSQQLEIAGGVAGAAEPPADALAHQAQGKEQNERSTLGGGHALR